jgi:hypothetical protein
MEHLRVREAEHAAALAGKLCIAPSVGLERVPAVVELPAVDLDDEPPGSGRASGPA